MDINYDTKVLEEIKKLKQKAMDKTGLNDFGDPFFEEPLAAWLTDLQVQDISDLGRQILNTGIFRDLCRRLKVHAYLADHPEILEVEIPPIILISGAPRTGTTLLHNLMNIHPHSRPFLRWELMDPLPPPTSETYATDPRIPKIQAAFEPLRNSLYGQMHWVDADDPDENTWGFVNCTGLFGRGVGSLMATWKRCLDNLDHRPVFREFRKLIQLLIWKYPPPPGGHLLLKCPMTAASVKAFAEVFPEAVFTLIHRDPFRVLISSCTIAVGISRPFIREEPGPMHKDGSRVQELFGWLKTIFSALMDFEKAEPGRVTNVRYADLMNDAVSTTRSIYDSLKMKVPEDLEKRTLDYLEQQRTGKRTAPPKTFETFGFDADSVWSDPIVAEYCKYFGIERERSRISDTKTGI